MAVGIHPLQVEVIPTHNVMLVPQFLSCALCLALSLSPPPPPYINRQALTEVSVLSDVLQIILRHPQYISLLPLNERANKPDTVPPAYQYIVKKKALSVAAGILRKGTSSLSKSSSRGEREFHYALLNLRQRWRLRRMPNGTIQGDLSYRSGS